MTVEIRRSENLYRGVADAPVLRAADDGDGTTMVGHFAVFNEWTEIDSWSEGRFRERIQPGAFAKTIAESRDSVRVQFDHGYDTHIGSAPLGPLEVLREDDHGVYYEVPLLETDYNRQRILPLLSGQLMNGERAGSQLGASFRFSVVKDRWDDHPPTSADNPDALPERTITELRLFEAGPVVFPAYQGSTSGVRSLTDHYLECQRARSRGIDPAPTEAGETATPGVGQPEADRQVTSGVQKRRTALVEAQTYLARRRA